METKISISKYGKNHYLLYKNDTIVCSNLIIKNNHWNIYMITNSKGVNYNLSNIDRYIKINNQKIIDNNYKPLMVEIYEKVKIQLEDFKRYLIYLDENHRINK